MNRTPLHQQVDSLPDMVREAVDPFIAAVRTTFTKSRSQKSQRIFLTGCGDSHHVPLNAELAFEQLARLPCEPMTAMQFARYAVGYLPQTGRVQIWSSLFLSAAGSAGRWKRCDWHGKWEPRPSP